MLLSRDAGRRGSDIIAVPDNLVRPINWLFSLKNVVNI